MKDIAFTSKAWSDFIDWSKTDRKIFEKISLLIEETSRTPFKGTGKPEPLKYQLKGYWSRRISEEHRLVYAVGEHEIQIISCKYHYQSE
jgi:toxin YoeB